eukprot:6463063-Amphidinium_carterae.1
MWDGAADAVPQHRHGCSWRRSTTMVSWCRIERQGRQHNGTTWLKGQAQGCAEGQTGRRKAERRLPKCTAVYAGHQMDVDVNAAAAEPDRNALLAQLRSLQQGHHILNAVAPPEIQEHLSSAIHHTNAALRCLAPAPVP